ncbi:MAG: hypothetical protein Q4B21_04650 [Bacteroidia bacterium]|nr:hypothetical protein [Bacteroidia bacterium]
MKINLKLYSILICLLMPVIAAAQQDKEIMQAASIELTQHKSLWFNTKNASGLLSTPLADYSEVSVAYKNESGKFARLQQGDLSTLSVNTHGAIQIGETMLWGNFTYDNITVKNSLYNTLLYDPFREMPYNAVDANKSNWKKQSYLLNAKVAFPMLWDFLAIGCEIDYNSRTGAKQLDPRTTNYNYFINVRPGFSFHFAKNHILGFNLEYENYYERTTPTNSDSQNYQPVYLLKGLGVYTNEIIGGSNGLKAFYYKANKIGIAGQYAFNSNGAFKMLLDAGYTYKVEDVYQTPTKPQRMGTVKQKAVNATAQFLVDGQKNTHKAVIKYANENTDGIEYIQYVDNSEDVNDWVTLDKYIRSNYKYTDFAFTYNYFRESDRGYSWNAGFEGKYSDNDDIYYLPESKMRIRNFVMDFFVKKNFSFGPKSTLLFGLDFAFNSNMEGMFSFPADKTPEQMEFIENFYNKDLAILSSNYTKIGALLNFATVVKNKTSLFFKVNIDYYKPGASLNSSDNRVGVLGSIGINF